MGLFGRIRGDGPITREQQAEFHWDTEDPFMFASHHFDDYPEGNRQQAPPYEEIRHRTLGHDYRPQNGYRMYQGKVAPGFTLHTHWGYETITVCSEGYIDHFDSEGNQGRFGFGDVQWVTAGSRYSHCEMYPLAFADRRNPHLITQIMINLPLEQKNTPNEVRTIWSENIPAVNGEGYRARVICGEFGGKRAECASGRSWASDPAHHVLILQIAAEPGAEIVLPPSEAKTRNVYLTESGATVGGRQYRDGTRLKARPEAELHVTNGDRASEIWVLEGDPIGQRMSSYGPVVLGTDAEVRDANNVVRRDEVHTWPWDYVNKTQPVGTARFFRDADGAETRPTQEDPRELPHAVPFPPVEKEEEKPVEEKRTVPDADEWNEDD